MCGEKIFFGEIYIFGDFVEFVEEKYRFV